MSADEWQLCKNCVMKTKKRLKKLFEEGDKEQYDKLKEKLDDKYENYDTFVVYTEIYQKVKNGEVYAEGYWSGSCEHCGKKIDVKIDSRENKVEE